MRFISLEKAQEVLGNLAIVLESQIELTHAYEADYMDSEMGHLPEPPCPAQRALWHFNLSTGRIECDHESKRYVAAIVHDQNGVAQLALMEPEQACCYTQRLIVNRDYVVVQTNPRGLVRVKTRRGLNGDVLTLASSVLTVAELHQLTPNPDWMLQLHPDKSVGFTPVYRVRIHFPDSEGMTPSEFIFKSSDALSIAAVAKLMR